MGRPLKIKPVGQITKSGKAMITMHIPPELKQRIIAAATKRGMSHTSYCALAIGELLMKDDQQALSALKSSEEND